MSGQPTLFEALLNVLGVSFIAVAGFTIFIFVLDIVADYQLRRRNKRLD